MTLTLAPETETRLLAAAAHRNMAPEAVVDAALEMLLRAEPVPAGERAAEQTEQERLQAVMRELIAEAQALVPEPFNSPTRQAYRENTRDAVIVEKFRRQGFNL